MMFWRRLRRASSGQPEHDHGAPAAVPVGAKADPFETQMRAGMLVMMQDMHAPRYTGDHDVDFLNMMIPHHQGAVDMARLVLIYGKDPLTRTLAEEIIASQQIEIQAMRGRLAALQARPETEAAPFPLLSGTRGPIAP